MRRIALALLHSVFALFISASAAPAQQTPPVMPRIQQTPLPPPVELPAPQASSPQAPVRPITAEEAARIALRNQPDILVARAGIDAARGRVQQARSGLLPTIGVGAGYTQVTTISGGVGGQGGGTTGGQGGGSVVTVPGYQASVNLRQLLFDFGRTRNQVGQAEALASASEANLARAQADLVFQVKQAFYLLSESLRLVEVNEANVRNRQAQLALAEARLRSGLGIPLDVVRAQTGVAQAIQGLQVARNNASLARVSLAERMGLDPRTPIQAADAREPEPPDVGVENLFAVARRQRPEVRQAQENVRAAEEALRAAEKGSLPALAANLGVGARDSDFPPRNAFASVGASLQWNPFDAGLTSGRAREARANLASARAQLASVEQQVQTDVAAAFLNLQTAEQRLTTAAAENANAEEALRLAEGRYRAGLGSFLEITDAQTALLAARTSRVNAASALDQARAALNRAVGGPSALPR